MSPPDGPHLSKLRNRYVLGGIWLAVAAAALYFYFFRSDLVQSELREALSLSMGLAGVVYLILGILRAFTLIPSTYLIVAGLPFFSPVPLFVLTMAGILISSAMIYFFSEKLRLVELFDHARHRISIARLKEALEKNELPIIVGWSFFPLAPTDLICYVCGILQVNFFKFILGILIGEGIICAVYIFAGDSALRFLNIRG